MQEFLGVKYSDLSKYIFSKTLTKHHLTMWLKVGTRDVMCPQGGQRSKYSVWNIYTHRKLILPDNYIHRCLQGSLDQHINFVFNALGRNSFHTLVIVFHLGDCPSHWIFFLPIIEPKAEILWKRPLIWFLPSAATGDSFSQETLTYICRPLSGLLLGTLLEIRNPSSLSIFDSSWFRDLYFTVSILWTLSR